MRRWFRVSSVWIEIWNGGASLPNTWCPGLVLDTIMAYRAIPNAVPEIRAREDLLKSPALVASTCRHAGWSRWSVKGSWRGCQWRSTPANTKLGSEQAAAFCRWLFAADYVIFFLISALLLSLTQLRSLRSLLGEEMATYSLSTPLLSISYRRFVSLPRLSSWLCIKFFDRGLKKELLPLRFDIGANMIVIRILFLPAVLPNL